MVGRSGGGSMELILGQMTDGNRQKLALSLLDAGAVEEDGFGKRPS